MEGRETCTACHCALGLPAKGLVGLKYSLWSMGKAMYPGIVPTKSDPLQGFLCQEEKPPSPVLYEGTIWASRSAWGSDLLGTVWVDRGGEEKVSVWEELLTI